MRGNMYMQYGCGWSAPAGWVNFDASPTLRFERLPVLGRLYTKNASRFPANARFGDIVAGLPLKPNSCDGVYCSHVLEHLSLADFNVALANTWAYLKPGGTFRLVLPDMESLARDYLQDTSETAAMTLMEKSGMAHTSRSRSIKGFIRAWLGNSAHLWMWDEKSMRAKLRQHGFTDIRRASFGDSSDRMFSKVEDITRFEGNLAMECKKPL